MKKHNHFCVLKGDPVIPGANRTPEGMNFAVEVPEGKEASLVLYRKGHKAPYEEIPFTDRDRTGRVCSMLLKDFEGDKYEYNFRIDDKICQDSCAYGIKGREHFGEPFDAEDQHKVRCSFLSTEEYDWQDDQFPDIPYADAVIYKVHVRGYTRQARIPVKKRGTFSGLIEMIPYWKELGVNIIELMPAYEFPEVPFSRSQKGMIMEKRKENLVNYWGYISGFYFSPKSSYCAGNSPENEFRDLVRALHREGMECIMEMYFPKDTSPWQVLRAVWFWKMFYHVDGFHFVGDGVPTELLKRDPILYRTKKMFSHVPEGAESSDMLAEYNPAFLQDMRRYLKSDEGMIPAVEYHIRHNSSGSGTVHYMAGQDGFTLYDTVSYNYRHNEANGESNHDGSEFNYSWNCGIEGPTRKQAVRKMREQQLRNAFLLLLFSQGIPLIYGGDEFGNSQEGNNNAWCQDNPVGWTNWKAVRKNKKLQDFVKEAIAFRRIHPILHMPAEMKGVDYLAKGFPDISFHGERAWYLGRENTSRLLGVMYCGAYAEKEDGTQDDFIYIGYNFHWENRTIALPNLPDGMVWKKMADTSETEGDHWFKEGAESFRKSVKINPRTIIVLVARQEETEHASMVALQKNNEA